MFLLRNFSKTLPLCLETRLAQTHSSTLRVNSTLVLFRIQAQTFRFFFNVVLVWLPFLLLIYSFKTQALTASTAQIINGSKPYLTFDNGVTKATNTDGLLSISLSDGTTTTTYNPVNNISTADNPIVLPKETQSFADIGMLLPATTDSIALSDLIDEPYNYWGDDDGDGKDSDGVSASGYLSIHISDKNNQAVSRSATLDLSKAPYKLVLTTTDGSLTTRYGIPDSSHFTSSSVTYYIAPNSSSVIRYIRTPNVFWDTGKKVAASNIWVPQKGFLVQATKSSAYSSNFPTTGANNLYFDLDITGSGPLRWPAVTVEGITATMTPNDSGTSVQVKLTGPVATAEQIQVNSVGEISKPTLPKTFELVGYDSNNRAILKYGFVLKHWFVNRGDKTDTPANHSSWCSSLGYRLPQVKDLTNANIIGGLGFDVATRPSSGNYYQRNIDAGLFTEWGAMKFYTDAGFALRNYWTIDTYNSFQFTVYSQDGFVNTFYSHTDVYGVCTYP